MHWHLNFWKNYNEKGNIVKCIIFLLPFVRCSPSISQTEISITQCRTAKEFMMLLNTLQMFEPAAFLTSIDWQEVYRAFNGLFPLGFVNGLVVNDFGPPLYKYFARVNYASGMGDNSSQLRCWCRCVLESVLGYEAEKLPHFISVRLNSVNQEIYL